MGVKSNLCLLNEAIAFKASDLDGGSLRLYQNDFVPNRNSVVGDFTVADFGNYANATIATWSAPFMDILGRAICLAPTQLFTCDGTAPANLIYGWYYLNVAGDWLMAGAFDSPVSMSLITDALPLAIQWVDAQP